VASPWLTLAEAALYTKLAPISLLRAVKAGQLRAIKVSGKKLWRFKTTDLDAWLEAHTLRTNAGA
jgi:excisionase family DNA binding protein